MMDMQESDPEPVQLQINGFPNKQIHGILDLIILGSYTRHTLIM